MRGDLSTIHPTRARPRTEVEANCCELGHNEVQEAGHGLSVARHAAVIQVEEDEVQAGVLRELREAAARRLRAA